MRKHIKLKIKGISLAILAIVVISFTEAIYGQISITGKIVDEMNVPIPYANVGIFKEGIGTVSNRKGDFELNIPEELLDYNISISHVGFEPLSFKVKEIPQNIELKRALIKLDVVTISASEIKEKEIGSRSKAGLLISGFSYKDLGGEVGRKFSIKQTSIIERIGFHVKHNSFDSIILRLNIYSIEKRLPGQLLSGNNFITISDQKTGQMECILRDLFEVHEDVIVTIELVEHFPLETGYIYFSQVPPYLGKMYYRETSFDKIKKYIGGPMSMYLMIKF